MIYPLLSLLFGVLGLSALPHTPPPIEGSALLAEARNATLAEELSPGEVRTLLDRALTAFSLQQEGQLRSYWIARAHLARAIHFNLHEDKKTAREAGEAGLEAIRSALQGGEFAEGLRVEADLHSQMMFSRGIIYMVRNGERAREAAIRALELDPTNTTAMINVAGYYIHAPRIAGGDPKEGEALLRDVITLTEPRSDDRFVALGMIAGVYLEEGSYQNAADRLAQARAIHPQSSWIEGLQKELDKKRR